MHIHLVALDIPTPPNYGGAVDMLWKIQALHECGVQIHLHAFQYGGREPSPELVGMCHSIHLYPRNNSLLNLLSPIPIMALSRQHPDLLQRLQSHKFPILFEGIHTAATMLQDPSLAPRSVIRTHNVESRYYANLASDERRWWRKAFLTSEARKLFSLEPRLLRMAGGVATISDGDLQTLSLMSGRIDLRLIGPFHGMHLSLPEGCGATALFHANLAVPENHNAAMWLVTEVAPIPGVNLIIAGRQPSEELSKACHKSRVEIIPDPEEARLGQLIATAGVHLLPGDRGDGIKLKVLRALLQGRHVVCSPRLVENTRLRELCILAETANEFRRAASEACTKPLLLEERDKRKAMMQQSFNDLQNARDLMEMLIKVSN